MKQAIVILLKKNKEINKIRKEYDPNYRKFEPHLTLVFPFEDLNQKKLNKHIKKSIKGIESFKIVLKGLKKSAKEYYLYLLVSKGNLKIKRAYRKLNSDILSGVENKDMPKYIPHVTLGIFKTKKQIEDAIKEVKKEKLNINYLIDGIHLVTLKKNNSIKSIRKFKLE